MKTLLASILLTSATFARAELALPSPPDRQRYTDTLVKSPFVLETKVADTKGSETLSPFKDLYLRGIGKADGKDFVLVQRLGEERTMKFFGGEAGEDSIVVKTVKVGANFRETKVILQKGSETGEVGFKEEAISRPPQQAIQVRPGGAPQPIITTAQHPPVPSPMINPMVPRPQVTPGVQLPKPQGNVKIAPVYNSATYNSNNAMKAGAAIRQNDPNRRQRTPIISN